MNTVSLIGRLTKEVDLRYTSNGKAVANGTLAVDRYSKGENKTDFIPFVIWEKQAENLANFTRKGSKVAINGSIQTSTYENKKGDNVFKVEVVANPFSGFELLEPKSVTEQRPREESQSYSSSDNQDDDPFINSGQSIDISDDDLPF